MRAVLRPTQGIVRFYDEGDYDSRSPFCAVANVLWLDEETACIVGMHGKINKRGIQSLIMELRNLGVKTVLAERNGRKTTYHLEDL